MIDWKTQALDLKDDSTGGKIWREIAMIEAQRKTAEQLHLIAQTLSTILEMNVDSTVSDPGATVAVKANTSRVMKIREALGEMK